MPDTSARIKLTQREINQAKDPKPGENDRILRDTEVPGLAVRIWTGGRAFIVEKRVNGRLIKRTIGSGNVLTVEQARQTAREHISAWVRGEGLDPVRKDLTFGELATRYLEEHAQERKRPGSVENDRCALRALGVKVPSKQWWALGSEQRAEDKKRTAKRQPNVEWANRRLSSITREEIQRLHRTIGREHRTQANRTVALLRCMFNLARKWGVFTMENPATGIERYREEKRDRFVLPSELPRFVEALREEPDLYVQAAIWTALFTGQRKAEVLSMRWGDVDLQERTWRIPQTKAHRPHVVPLPRPVVGILTRLPRVQDNPHVFVGRREQGHLTGIRSAWMRICKAAALGDVRFHDLRRTVGSWLAASGASLPLIGKTLNHSQANTTMIYARLQLDPVREALEANATKMLTIVGAEKIPTAEKSRKVGISRRG